MDIKESIKLLAQKNAERRQQAAIDGDHEKLREYEKEHSAILTLIRSLDKDE